MVKPGLTVLQVIPELDAGGAERTTLEIAEALTRTGNRALVVSEGGRMEAELESMHGELFRLPVKSKSIFTIKKNQKAIEKIIREYGVDIVHARSRAPAWSAYWAARATGTAFVTTYHGAYGGKSAIKKWYNSVMARGDIVIANSHYIADHVKAVHGVPDERIVTIQRGVDLHAFDAHKIDPAERAAMRAQYTTPEKRLAILPGRLTDWKGQGVLIEALGRLPSDLLESCHFALIGDAQGRDGYVEDLKTAIDTYNLDELVSLSGHCSNMPVLYSACDLVLSPSKRPEAFGRVAVEAQAMGKPVIASDHGGQRETVKHKETGWLVPPDDPDGLAQAISEWLHMPVDDCVHMSIAATDWARNTFSTELLQRKTLEVYSQVLKERQETLH